MDAKWKLKGTWRQKLEKDQQPKIVDIPPKMQKQWGTGTMLISTAKHIDQVVKTIPKEKLVTVAQLMAKLAKDAGADTTCPMTTGIFMRIVAETAEEDRRNGKKKITPYWRVIKTDGSLNEKYPGGSTAQANRLREEGHTLESAIGKKPPKVIAFELTLMKL